MKISLFSIIFLFFNLLFQEGSAKAELLKVVTSFSILKDLVQEVGGDNISVESIVAPNSDTHVYEPTPQDAKKLANAGLVFINGMGFEGWVQRLIEASGYKGEVIKTTDKIVHKQEASHIQCKNKTHPTDPHAWHSLQNTIQYINVISEALIKKDPAHAVQYKNNAQRYKQKLEALDKELRKKFSQIPLGERIIVTTHNGFGYFGKEYGITFLSPVGLSTESEPSPKVLTHIIDKIKKNGIKMIFLENITSPKLIEQLAHETGAKVGPVVYSDALSNEKGPASTYLDMMTYNANLFLQSLREKLAQ